MEQYDIVIIGGGPAGLAAALAAKNEGTDSILIIERDYELGGILNQCIHNGFGLHTFREELTGPEYAQRFVDKVLGEQIEYRLNSMVIDITRDKLITVVSPNQGLYQIQAKAIILAMGCRERSKGALNIPGSRPAGIYSAGTAQRLVNMEGYMPGKEVVILGSGDIGLIMARRMTLEGAKVKVVAEIMPYSGGLKRNIVQCLDDFNIPLKLSHTVVNIKGKDRVESITLAEVDANRKPIIGTEEVYTCDTLLLSVGLIPENELSIDIGVELDPITQGPKVSNQLETNIAGVFACGNVLHVHDLVDFVSQEASLAGKYASQYIHQNQAIVDASVVEIHRGSGVRYTVPSYINMNSMEEVIIIRFRVDKVYQNAYICVNIGVELLSRKKKLIMAPGEMEEVKLERKHMQGNGCLDIYISIEEA